MVWSTALTIKPLQPLAGFKEVSKSEYEAHQQQFNKNKIKFDTDEGNPNLIQTEEHEQYHQKGHSKYSKHQRKVMKQAKANDEAMYGGKLFRPKIGHEMYFDFESFAQYAEIHTMQLRRHIKKTQQRSNSSGYGNTQDFFNACIEFNICTSPHGGGACVVFGMTGTVTLATSNQEGQEGQTLSISVAAGVGVKLQVVKKIAASVFILGQLTWVFQITGNPSNYYTSAFEATLGAIKFWLNNMSSKKMTLHNNLIAAAMDSRGSVAAKNEDSPKPQDDELKGMVKIHYEFLRLAHTKFGEYTQTPAEAHKIIQWALIKAIWKQDKQVLDPAMCKCGSLKPDTDRVLLCTVLTLAPLLPDNKKKYKHSGFAWKDEFGTQANFVNGLPLLYKEIWPSDTVSIQMVKEAITGAMEKIDQIKPGDWDAVTVHTSTVKDESGVESEIKTGVAAPSIIAAAAADPALTLRTFLQYLACSSTDLSAVNYIPPNESQMTFSFVNLNVAGVLGVTVGAGGLGYCTTDPNKYQFQLQYSRDYDPTTAEWDGGWWDGAKKNIWVRYQPVLAIPIYLTLTLIPKPIAINQAIVLNVAISIPTTAPTGSGTPEWLKNLATGDTGTELLVAISSGLTGLINMFEGSKFKNDAATKNEMTTNFQNFLKGDTKDNLITGLERAGVPVGEAFAKKGLSTLITGLFTAAAGELIGGSVSTEIWVGMQISCSGVTELKQCFGSTVPAGVTVEYDIGLTTALAVAHVFSFAGNHFKVLTGQNIDLEAAFLKREGQLVKK